MQYEEFIDEVQDKTNLRTAQEAIRIIEVTLETLGERISQTERNHLASQLPKNLKDRVHRYPEEHFTLEEFYNRISARADMRYPHAVEQSRAVAAVIRKAVAPGELENILSALPREYRELFGEPPKGPLSPTAEERPQQR